MIAMVNHLASHAAIDADVLPRDEARFVGTEEHHHVGDVHRITYSANGMLNGIRPLIDSIGCIYPSWRYAVHMHLSCKADSQRMGQGGYAAFGSRVALGLRLAHAVT